MQEVEDAVLEAATNMGGSDDTVKVILKPTNSEENQELLGDVTKIAQYTGKGEEKK